MLERFEPAISYAGAYSDAAYMERDDSGQYVKFEDAERLRVTLDELVMKSVKLMEILLGKGYRRS